MHFIHIIAKIQPKKSESCSLLVLNSARKHSSEGLLGSFWLRPLVNWTLERLHRNLGVGLKQAQQ